MNGNFWTVQIDYTLIAAAILCVLPAALIVAVILRKIKQHRANRLPPFKELRRRPAGESLRIKLESLEQQLDDKIMLLLAFPCALIIVVFMVKPRSFMACFVLFSFSLIWTLFFRGSVTRLLEERWKYQLGFDGERYVGEELSRLIAHGFEIYHDVPFDGFNMDHVLVGPQGVFVVETKTRSKPVDGTGEKEFRVQFNGKSLRWPWGEEKHDIEQARNNAATLSNWLTKAIGDTVKVSPILTLPGWWIERSVPLSDLYILNPREITRIYDSTKITLDQEMIRRICYQLDQKCRIEIQ